MEGQSALRLNLSAVYVLWKRDMVRFFRQRSRVVGALGQPVLMWFVLGSGLAGSFRVPGAGDMDYHTYFYPGVVVMIVLFTAIFTTISVIEDRHEGFLQAVIAAPASRASLVMGKILGSTTVAMLQAAFFLMLAPLAGYPYGVIEWFVLGQALLLTGMSLTALGFVIAWVIDNVQGYHAIMMIVLMPLWLLSGAAFPVEGASPWMQWVMKLNPVTYSVEAVRLAIAGSRGSPQLQVMLARDMIILIVFTLFMLTSAVMFCRRRV
ncbi:MAG: ABC transporter permease [Deltaproteobacteria bacterium]|nr:ABC transporter permease [Deltaproteobacteria bacterium]